MLRLELTGLAPGTTLPESGRTHRIFAGGRLPGDRALPMADEEQESPKFITPPNTLKAKVGPPTPGGVDLEALERAEAIIANLTDSYLEWVQEDLNKIQAAYEAMAAAGAKTKADLDKVFHVAHDIKGQGGSFGYNLMTVVGNQLCRFLEKKESLTPSEIQAVKVHIDTMKLIIAQKMTGDGGAEGTKLLKGLEFLLAKLSK